MEKRMPVKVQEQLIERIVGIMRKVKQDICFTYEFSEQMWQISMSGVNAQNSTLLDEIKDIDKLCGWIINNHVAFFGEVARIKGYKGDSGVLHTIDGEYNLDIEEKDLLREEFSSIQFVLAKDKIGWLNEFLPDIIDIEW